jgi:uncharacterized protein with PIN domain
MLGFDTLFFDNGDDRDLAAISAEQQRILLSRDRDLLMRRVITHGCYVRSMPPLEQLVYVIERLDLCRAIKPFSRCINCNGRLEAVAKEKIEHRLLDDTREAFHEFRQCQECGQIYWKGSHYQKMQRLVKKLCGNPQ